MSMSELTMPPVMRVTVEPARIPTPGNDPRGAIGGGVGITTTVAEPKIAPLVALTVLANVPVAPPAVKRPVAATMLPPLFTTDPTRGGGIGTTLKPASLPTAVNCCVAPMASVSGFGVTVIVKSGPAITVTVAVPKIAPWVALTVLATVPIVLPAVKKPVALMLPGGLTVDQTGVIATTLPLASLPTAVNCCVPPMTSVGFGVTVIVKSGPAVTVIVTLTVIPLQVTAITVVPAVVPAVNSPVVLPIVPPPETIDQVGLTARTAPFEALATTVNCIVPFTAMVCGEVGEMVSVVTMRGEVESLHAAVNNPANATATMTGAMRVR